MVSKTFEIIVKSTRRKEFIEITPQIERMLKESGITNGIVVLFVPHTTAGITINEHADPSVKSDIEDQLSILVPESKNYKHLEGNADAHIKSVLVGNSLNLLIENGRLLLGTWQGIFFAEFDGPRTRKILMKIVGE
ncbi:MAG: secondary thiamine-phosphate synthase enzyme YjbQ [bacterium]|nr:secondary thiamine-phosphate synthase enzyme YjbQ [bacterium]